jgi:hypothetical protein
MTFRESYKGSVRQKSHVDDDNLRFEERLQKLFARENFELFRFPVRPAVFCEEQKVPFG